MAYVGGTTSQNFLLASLAVIFAKLWRRPCLSTKLSLPVVGIPSSLLCEISCRNSSCLTRDLSMWFRCYITFNMFILSLIQPRLTLSVQPIFSILPQIHIPRASALSLSLLQFKSTSLQHKALQSTHNIKLFLF